MSEGLPGSKGVARMKRCTQELGRPMLLHGNVVGDVNKQEDDPMAVWESDHLIVL